ncbi:glycine betaine ABC transporter substrate-binding protein [Rubrobacter taiwanensis]|jgi:glycine betaine/proline transport system substrate-binding protein|uniref:Glycine betaine ABC transporter substrate-binding protein n=1 Tax=Rubrobacter taiwanensis TaxID=185139 RepID=A0A4V2NVX5_9ACTN|nr:glycine betaine ABC transporter substrate-binding protein [Rubrobacter taiwanensis]TCJ15152.1 glycine betaine ABC transporter substrate-binding protein [Rubrobacter taiwanensis]
MRPKKLFATLVTALLVGALAAGCGAAPGGGTLTLGNIGWDENIALSNLTKVALEDEFGYSVELQTLDVGPLFQGVANGDLDAFQDVWMPNHENYMAQVGDNVEMLDPWYESETRYGIAVPDYMEDIRSLEDLDQAGTDQITGIEPGAAFHPHIREEVLPAYGLEDEIELVESSTPAMLAELERAYRNQEPIIFLAWSPHWMNAEYDFHYLEDPLGAQEPFSNPSQLSTIVRADLQEDDPVAYAFLEAISMNEEEMNDLQAVIQEVNPDDPAEGARVWLEDNRDVVEPWIEAAREAQEEAAA